MEKYLLCLNKKHRIAFSRTNNTHLLKVTGRFKKTKVERYKRFCALYNENKLEYECHILFECTNEKAVLNRLKYISNLYFKEAQHVTMY